MILLLLFACHTKDIDCTTLSVDACAKNDACQVMTGRKVIATEGCIQLDRSEPIACQNGPQAQSFDSGGCGFFSAFISPDGSNCYQVGKACQPSNWTSCADYDTGDICH
jgi:hypothetical protein